MRWRGLARSRHADLPVARPLTLLNRSPGPETRRKSRFPGSSCVAGVSPGRSPFPATRDFYALQRASTRGFRGQSPRIFLSTRLSTMPVSLSPATEDSPPAHPQFCPQSAGGHTVFSRAPGSAARGWGSRPGFPAGVRSPGSRPGFAAGPSAVRAARASRRATRTPAAGASRPAGRRSRHPADDGRRTTAAISMTRTSTRPRLVPQAGSPAGARAGLLTQERQRIEYLQRSQVGQAIPGINNVRPLHA